MKSKRKRPSKASRPLRSRLSPAERDLLGISRGTGVVRFPPKAPDAETWLIGVIRNHLAELHEKAEQLTDVERQAIIAVHHAVGQREIAAMIEQSRVPGREAVRASRQNGDASTTLQSQGLRKGSKQAKQALKAVKRAKRPKARRTDRQIGD